MAKCVMCAKEVNGFYDYEGAKIPVCFEHYEDGTFANYLAAQQSVQSDGACACAYPMPQIYQMSRCVECGGQIPPRR